MSELPTNTPDAELSDFEADLKRIPDADLEFIGKFSIEVLVEGEDAKRLSRIASERGQRPGEVVAELVRNFRI